MGGRHRCRTRISRSTLTLWVLTNRSSLKTNPRRKFVLKTDRKIARHVRLSDAALDADVRELSKHTSIEDVAQTIRDSPPPEP